MADTVAIDLASLKGSHDIRNKIVEVRRQMGLSSIQMAYLLHRVKEEFIYLDWDHPSFESAMSDPDIGISRSTAYGLIQVWETWVEKYGLSPDQVAQVPYDKLLMIAPVVNDDNHAEMFESAKSLSRQDLVHIKMEKKANRDLPDFKPMPRIWRCKNCGKWTHDALPEDMCTGH